MLTLLASGLLIITYIVTGKMILRWIIRFLMDHGVKEMNFAGEVIPQAAGLFVWVMVILYYVVLRCIHWIETSTGLQLPLIEISNDNQLVNEIIALSIIFFVGWLDDTIGDQNIKGFSGHIGKWMSQRVVTTGLLKAVVTSIVAGWLVIEVNGLAPFSIVQAMILILMTNAMNLLDLRPGRMLKVFFVLSTGMLLFVPWSLFLPFLFPVLTAAVLVFPQDLKAKVMLGDAGANMIGFTSGFCLIVTTNLWIQMVILAMLIAFHWIAAKSSITKIVEQIPLLHWFDRWGRA